MLRALVLAIMVASCSPRFEPIELASRPDAGTSTEGLEFSEPRIGESVARIPSRATDASSDFNCQAEAAVQPVCYLSDGVLIVSLAGVVVAKSVRVARPPSTGLPYGLRADDSPAQALQRLYEFTGVPVVGLHVPYGGLAIVNRRAFRNEAGTLVHLLVNFDLDDHLSSVVLIDASLVDRSMPQVAN